MHFWKLLKGVMESKLPSPYYSDHCVELFIGYVHARTLIWDTSDKNHERTDLVEKQIKEIVVKMAEHGYDLLTGMYNKNTAIL